MSDIEMVLQPETSAAPKLATATELASTPSPMELGQLAEHEPEPAPALPRRRRTPPKAAGFPCEVSPLAKVPMAELLAEVDRRYARAKVLHAERERVLAKMEALEAAMGVGSQAGFAAATSPSRAAESRPRRQRAKNSVSLADALAQAVEVRATVTPAEAAQLVLSNGYQSAAKNFGMVVANALAKDARFARRGRGQYERIS